MVPYGGHVVNVGVIGSGRVGLVTGACLASLGHDVVCTDSDAAKISQLREGRPHFLEPDLERLLRAGLADGRLRFADTIEQAVADAEVVLICVGRPPVGGDDRSLTAVEESARAIARSAGQGVVVVVKSTVPPGTNGRVMQVMASERPDLTCAVVSNPEFLREGHAVRDTLEPDRLVVGAADDRSRSAMRALYAPLLKAGSPLIETDPATAELAKLACNAFLATKVSYANGLARVAERAGADVVEVTRIMGGDPRIGAAFLGAGLGYGGYCLPKDIVTLERTASRLGYDFGLLREVVRINDEAVEVVARAVEEAVWNLEGKRLLLLGAAFKAGTDDVRAAPSLSLARLLLAAGAGVAIWDPLAARAAAEELPDLEVAEDPYAGAVGAHCAVVCTEWPEVSALDLPHLAGAMAEPVLVDARNCIDPAAARDAGLRYVPIGRPERNR
jgi:UDPglucose 6-dehydrogenase